MAFTILVVDDSETMRAVIKKTLRIAGLPIFEYFEANNGKEALDILGDNWVDLVLSDLNMPVMGGAEMIEKMSKDGLLKTIPVIVISTEGSQSRVEKLMSKGISAYLRKPFTPELIRDVINDIMGVSDEE